MTAELFSGNLDAVVRHAAAAAEANSVDVRNALNLVIQAHDHASRSNAATALRIALVAQAAGYEGTAANGSTFSSRCESARAALAAWDGVAS